MGQEQSEETYTLRRNIREMPGTAWFLTVGVFINRFGSFVVLFLALYLTRQLGFTAVQLMPLPRDVIWTSTKACWTGRSFPPRLNKRAQPT